MHSPIFLGFDIGTTGTKAVLIDDCGLILAFASLPTAVSSLHPGWAEEDAESWWANVCQLAPECLRRAGRAAADVAAVGVSGMVPAVVLIGADGAVLRASIQQNDTRAVLEINNFQDNTSTEDILQRTGSAVTQQSVGPKLLWLRRNEPTVMANVEWVMGSYDFIVYRLTGEPSIERNWALESGLFDLNREVWAEDLINLAHISYSQMGPVRWPVEIVGGITREASRQTGLLAGTPVVAGSADHIASAFSTGIKANGDLLIKLGGAGDILCCVDQAMVDARLYLDYHVIPGKFLANGCMASSGSLIHWFRNELAPNTSFDSLDDEAARLSPGAEGLIVLPYFLGEKTPINDPLARGTLVGLTLGHKRAHIFRAVLEGISYGFYHHLKVLAEHGLVAARARVANGGTRSNLWKQISADVLGLPLEELENHPGSSLGAAFIAGKGVGRFNDWEEIEKFLKISRVIEPNLYHHAYYQENFYLYQEIYAALKGIFPLLNVSCDNRSLL